MKIVLADDHVVVRRGFEAILNCQPDMEVAASAGDGREALELVARYRPDLLLLDISMPPGESGLVTAGKMQQEYPDTRVIILSMYSDREYLLYTIEHGASGYVLKTAPEEELLDAIRTVHVGGVYISKEMMPYLVSSFRHRGQEQEDAFLKLGDREMEILTLIAKGYGNKEIAEMLHLSVKTVESTKNKIMTKLNVTTRPELVEYAARRGLVRFG